MSLAADAERARIERNLHDGAQQRLVALQFELGLLAEQIEVDPPAARASLDRLRVELDEAVEELRDLAHGLYPPLLASDGVVAALEAAARRSPIRASVAAGKVGRLPEPVEVAAYFCCLEALQNAGKHAGPGAAVTIRVDARDGELCFCVSDDGVGFDATHANGGQGVVNLHDRVGALGGRAEVQSAPGEGTVVSGSIPLS